MTKTKQTPVAPVSAETVEQEFKPFTQTPSWKIEDDFTIKGNEFESIYNLLNIFIPAITALQAVFERSVQSGLIQIKHEYTDGSGEVPQDVLQAYYTKLRAMMQEQLESTNPVPVQEQS